MRSVFRVEVSVQIVAGAMFTLLLAGPASHPVGRAKERARRDDFVGTVKALDVASLDAELSAQPLAQWFPAVIGSGFSEPVWKRITCGQDVGRTKGPPRCVRVASERQLRRVKVVVAVEIRVGTVAGPRETPSVDRLELRVNATDGRSPEEDAAELDTPFLGYRLSQLPSFRDQVREYVELTGGDEPWPPSRPIIQIRLCSSAPSFTVRGTSVPVRKGESFRSILGRAAHAAASSVSTAVVLKLDCKYATALDMMCSAFAAEHVDLAGVIVPVGDPSARRVYRCGDSVF